MLVKLLVLEGQHQGLSIKLPLTQFVIGRDPTCHLRPASTDVSRFHCAIAQRDRQVLVRDLKSTNGTFVNDERIVGTARVQNADVLRVGPLRFQFEIDVLAPRVSASDSNLHWLLRMPDTEEEKLLDPGNETLIVSCLAESVADASPPASEPSAAPPSAPSAVAGKFLHEYLKQRAATAEPPFEPLE